MPGQPSKDLWSGGDGGCQTNTLLVQSFASASSGPETENTDIKDSASLKGLIR